MLSGEKTLPESARAAKACHGAHEPAREPADTVPSLSRFLSRLSRRSTKVGETTELGTRTSDEKNPTTKQNAYGKLQFAPEELRVRREDMPPDFDADDLYRGLDGYLEARRIERHRRRRAQRRQALRESRTQSRHSDSGSSSDSDSHASTSSSSTNFVAAYIPGISRLRALFGDSDSSDSESSTSESGSESASSGSASLASGSEYSRRSRVEHDTPSVFGRTARRRRSGSGCPPPRRP